MIIITLNPASQLILLDEYPIRTKGKSCYFIKKDPMVFHKGDPDSSSPVRMKDHLISGELSPQPLEHLIVFFDGVCPDTF